MDLPNVLTYTFRICVTVASASL